MNFVKKKILITGGSSGIGKAIIAEFYRRGSRQIAVIARNPEKMKELEKEFPEAAFLFLTGDLAEPSTAKENIDRLKQHWDSIDILVNNAGVVSAGPLEDISDEDIIKMQNV